jgi:hypothetical protein
MGGIGNIIRSLKWICNQLSFLSQWITMLVDNAEWSITGVYGPQSDADKIIFMQEITDLRGYDSTSIWRGLEPQLTTWSYTD